MTGASPLSNRNGKRALSVASSGQQPSPKMRMTRQRSRLIAEDGIAGPSQHSNTSAGDCVQAGQVMERSNIDERDESQEYHNARSQHTMFGDGITEQRLDKICPITDKDTKHFRIMDLPAELRLNIYRCCLTRPFNIALSRSPPPPSPPPKMSAKDGRQDAYFDGTDDASDSEQEIEESSSRQRSQPARQNTAGRLLDRTTGPIFSGVRNLTSRTHRQLARMNMHIAPPPANNNNNIDNSNNTTTTAANITATTSANHTSNPQYVYAPGSVHPNITIPSPPASPIPSGNRSKPGSLPRPQDDDPLLIPLLRTSKQIYKEARNILYSENVFSLDLSTAQPTLSALHQRSRMQIKHLELTIPTHGDILERFAEVVRLSLRYCWGLKKFVIHMPFVLPGADGSGQSGNTTVYANAFDILRWLPQGCEVELRGNVCEEISAVVEKNARLRRSLDKVGYARRQLISSEAERTASDTS